jgi:hypothetical protein
MRRNCSMRGSLKWRTMMLRRRSASADFSRIVPRMAGEDEVGGRGQHLEAEPSVRHQLFAGGDDGLQVCSK